MVQDAQVHVMANAKDVMIAALEVAEQDVWAATMIVHLYVYLNALVVIKRVKTVVPRVAVVGVITNVQAVGILVVMHAVMIVRIRV